MKLNDKRKSIVRIKKSGPFPAQALPPPATPLAHYQLLGMFLPYSIFLATPLLHWPHKSQVELDKSNQCDIMMTTISKYHYL